MHMLNEKWNDCIATADLFAGTSGETSRSVRWNWLVPFGIVFSVCSHLAGLSFWKDLSIGVSFSTCHPWLLPPFCGWETWNKALGWGKKERHKCLCTRPPLPLNWKMTGNIKFKWKHADMFKHVMFVFFFERPRFGLNSVFFNNLVRYVPAPGTKDKAV